MEFSLRRLVNLDSRSSGPLYSEPGVPGGEFSPPPGDSPSGNVSPVPVVPVGELQPPQEIHQVKRFASASCSSR